jgi:hypothetical protein
MLRSGSRKTSALGGVATAVVLTLAACGSDGGADDGGWTPSRAIEVVAPAATGGGWDTLARTSSRILEESGLIDQDLRVINKPGAGGAIGWAYMAGATGDPHKLFVTSPPILLVPLSGESDHDHTDFTPIARLATDYMVYLASADSPLETFDDVVDALRDDPGGVSVAGGSAPGSMDHVAFAGAAGVVDGDEALALRLLVLVQRLDDEQLAPQKRGVLLGGDDGAGRALRPHPARRADRPPRPARRCPRPAPARTRRSPRRRRPPCRRAPPPGAAPRRRSCRRPTRSRCPRRTDRSRSRRPRTPTARQATPRPPRGSRHR